MIAPAASRRHTSGLDPQAVIFDLDGVLVDAEPLHHAAVNAVLAEDGLRPLSVAEYTRYLGATDEDLWRGLRAVRRRGRGAMVTRGKPDPEVFLVAAHQLRAQPARCVVFENSPAGVTAASRAGMYTIAVCTPYTPPGLARGAHFTVNSLAEVSRALRGRTVARAARQS